MGWTEYELGNLLSYEQPTPYIVETTDYKDTYSTPVLTAGKTFIIGYTNETHGIYTKNPVIIFDDFTTSTQYVNFSFKVKSSAMKILTANKSLADLKFLYYRIQLIDFDHSTHKRYWIQHYSKVKVKIPTIPEQIRIVSRIEELFSELNKAVGTLQTIKQQLSVYRQAVLKEAFEGNLTASWRASNSYNSNWRVASIRDVIKSERNALKAGPFGSTLKKEFYVSEGYKVYGQEQVISGEENLGDYYIDESKYQELIQCSIAPKDVLISLVGTVGKVLVLSDKCKPGIINPRLVKISLDPEKMLPEFFKHYFESAYLRSLYMQKTHGATMDVLNMGMIKQLPFPLCSIAEQKQVVREIKSRLAICENIKYSVNAAVQEVDYMYKSILKLAFEGGI